MADKRTTPHQKTKFSRSMKTPVNMNATYCDSLRNSSSSKSKPGSSTKPNLDVTCLNSTSAASRLKYTAPPAPAVDSELELTFVYNDYLQALLKQQIISDKISSHEAKLDDQICQQLQDIYSMEKKHSDMKGEIEKVEKLNEINELIVFTQKVSNELEILEKQTNLSHSLDKLMAMLEKACNKVIFKKVKPITTQEDYYKLLELLELCSQSIVKMLASTNNSEEIGLLADSINKLTTSKKQLLDKQEVLANQTEALAFKLLEDVSDYFAAENGY